MTHLSTQRKRKKVSIPPVVASERGDSPNLLRESLRALRSGGCRAEVVVPQGGPGVTNRADSRTTLDKVGRRG
jgi:hypothetical protein